VKIDAIGILDLMLDTVSLLKTFFFFFFAGGTEFVCILEGSI